MGVWISLLGSKLNASERLFCAFSYMPKATVQAAIGAIPLSMGVKGGEIILAIAVLSIIFTAPLGATLIRTTHAKLLEGPQD
jgi:NhaP-type Na+/H+ or K+/H+ antiporter